MATNWPPAGAPTWPPPGYGDRLEFSDIRTAVVFLRREGWTKALPTAQERNTYFKGVTCDEGHPTNGIMLVSPTGVRYPFAYCTGATHKTVLVLWAVGYDSQGQPCYDLGWDSGSGADTV